MSLPNLDEATFAELQDGLRAKLFTSVDLVKAYLARIGEVNPLLHAVISTSPTALKQAAELDAERQAGRVRGVLHGIPIGVKDNIATRIEDGMDTTAGSFALQGAVPPGDAEVVQRLREAGAIFICKTNLSVWANYRGVEPGGWSPVGGQCTNPYYPDGHPSGSSSGSAVATAVGLCAGALGTETNGSIVAPANFSALCGVRPTVGLVSQAGVVPITATKDAVGPMCRTVTDAAHLLQAIVSERGAGIDYTAGLKTDALAGQRVIVPENLWDWDAHPHGHQYLGSYKKVKFEEALRTIERLGAEVKTVRVDADLWDSVRGDTDALALTTGTEFKADLEAHLSAFRSVPSGVRNLEQLIAFTKEDPRESPEGYEGQSRLIRAFNTKGLTDAAYVRARANEDRAGQLVTDLLKQHDATAAVMPGKQPAFWSLAGFPYLVVPLGYMPADQEPIPYEDDQGKQIDLPYSLFCRFPNHPFGITFAGAAFSEATLLSYAYAFEQATHVREQSKPYAAAMPMTQLQDVMGLRCAA